MEVSLKKAFSILDGRLSTEIGDVYEMLNYIFDENFFTHQIPDAMRKVKEVNPKWFSDGVELIQDIKNQKQTDNFEIIINHIDSYHSGTVVKLGKIEAKFGFLDFLEKDFIEKNKL